MQQHSSNIMVWIVYVIVIIISGCNSERLTKGTKHEIEVCSDDHPQEVTCEPGSIITTERTDGSTPECITRGYLHLLKKCHGKTSCLLDLSDVTNNNLSCQQKTCVELLASCVEVIYENKPSFVLAHSAQQVVKGEAGAAEFTGMYVGIGLTVLNLVITAILKIVN